MSADPAWETFVHQLTTGYDQTAKRWEDYKASVENPPTGPEWVKMRGSTCWLPAVVMRNADGVLRERWFA